MAQPTYYPLWATEDTTLPNTDQTNKIRPKTTLREIGWDKGQIPSAEELNWQLNNIYQWIHFINEESLPLYLPKTGTSLSFTGDITGTATWSGDESTSVTLSSATLNAATASATASTLVKRGTAGESYFGDHITVWSESSTGAGDLFLGTNTSIVKASVTYSQSNDTLYIRKLSSQGGTIGSQVIFHQDGYVELTSPQSLSSQGTQISSLTRKDYVDGQISSLDSTLRAYVDSRSTASLAQNGWWKDEVTGTIYQWGFNSTVRDDGYVTVTLPITFPNSFFSVVATPSYSGSVGSTTSLGSHAHIISTSQFGLGVSDSRTGETVEGAFWIAIGR